MKSLKKCVFLVSLSLLTAIGSSGYASISPILPLASVTPGAVNPSVTQANIHSTICLSGYTSTIRPSSSYTTNLKKQQLAGPYAFYHDDKTADFEEDHLISLEIGGSPTSPKNLWPEPYAGPTGARVKDQIENKLHDLVCQGKISLSAAQSAIASNWYQAYEEYVLGKQTQTSPTPSVPPSIPSPIATQPDSINTPNPSPSASAFPAQTSKTTFKMPFLNATNINQVVSNWSNYGFSNQPIISVVAPAIAGDACKPWQGASGIASQILKTDPVLGLDVNSDTQVSITLMCDEQFSTVALPSPVVSRGPAAGPATTPSEGSATSAGGIATPSGGAAGVPTGATGKCVDGTYSFAASHRGMCSQHGGVAQFYP